MEKIIVLMDRDKDCVGSVRYRSDSKTDPVTNVYLSRSVMNGSVPQTIAVTIEVLD